MGRKRHAGRGASRAAHERRRANICSPRYNVRQVAVRESDRRHRRPRAQPQERLAELPRDALVVLTGLSGSGKSSLAFDTIYAEGQRRYVESLSAYARQFLGQMDKPDVDSIEGLSPAISIDQKTTSRNPRSTVGTVTEIYDYLRLLWARIGVPHCHVCGARIAGQTIEQIVDQVLELPEGTRFMVLAPVVRGRKGEYGKLLEELRAEGFARVLVDGELRGLDEEIVLDKKVKHDDRGRRRPARDARRTCASGWPTRSRRRPRWPTGSSRSRSSTRDGERHGETLTFSEKFACLTCGTSMPELEPRIFSFNAPQGACPRCTGLGLAARDRPRAGRARPRAVDRAGRARAVGGVAARPTTTR